MRDLFGAIARRYDLLNDLQRFGLHRIWKRRLVSLSGVGEGDNALDVCCGTGDVAMGLAGAGAKVIGLDFSPAMLDIARQRASAEQAVEYIQGDALQLPFHANRFDAVTISYGLRNLADLERGLREMWRVTREGGCILILDFGKPKNWLWRRLYYLYLNYIVPWLGRWFSGDAEAYAYIMESLRNYPAQSGVAQELTKLGGGEVFVRDVLGGVMSIHRVRKPLRPQRASRGTLNANR